MWLFFQPSFPQIFKQLLQKCILAADLLETWNDSQKGSLMTLLCSELSAQERTVSHERQQTQSLAGAACLRESEQRGCPHSPFQENTLRCALT